MTRGATRRVHGAIAALLLLLVACGGAAAERERRTISLGLSAGVFVPSDSTTADRFGDLWLSLGPGIFDREKAGRWTFTVDLSLLDNEDAGEATLIPLTFGAQRGFGASPPWQPYVAARVGPYYGSIDADRLNIHESSIGLNANAAVGIIFKRRYSLELRYDVFSRFADTTFDGVTVKAQVRLFDVKL